MGTIGTLRNYTIAHFFYKNSFYTQVVTQKNPAILSKDTLPFPPQNIYRVINFDYRSLISFFSIKKNEINNNINEKSTSISVHFFRQFIESFPFVILFGEGGFLYIICGIIKGIKLQKQHNFHYFYSSFRPYADHLISYTLKLFFPKTIWIADFRDVHVDPNRKNVFWIPFQKWCNRKILSKADIVTTVSKGLAKNLQQYHSNIYVLRNGIHQFLKEKTTAPLPCFTITYTGSLYPTMQTAEPFFAVIKQLIAQKKIPKNQIQIVYAGKDSLVWNKWIKDNELEKISTIKGLVSLEEARGLQSTSHINLLLSWSSNEMSGTLTGKFYEYLAARNSILLIINGTRDKEFEDIFQQTNAGMIAYHTAPPQEKIEHFILKKYHEWLKTGHVAKPISIESLQPFLWENQMQDFMHFLEQTSKSH